MKLVSRNLKNYLTALVGLATCAFVYCVTANQLLSVPDIPEVTPRPPTQSDSVKVGLADLFPEDAWQLGDCKRLLTERGTLLFKHWEQVDSERWVLEPLTIVIGRGISDERAESPIIMNAPEGAEIQFGEPIDMMGGTAPPIKMGRMIGEVTIDRANVRKRSETLAVQTRNVRIDNQKVWTTERINMQVAGANLRGIDLTLYLAASATSASKSETPSTILDRMDLVYLEEVLIPLDRPEDQRQSPRAISTPPGQQAAQTNGVVSIKCRNGLSYDFALDRLSLRDSISMVRTVNSERRDTFFCDTLDLALRDPANQSVERRGPLDWIDRIHATGRPATIDLASYDFRLQAEVIDFDASGGLLRAAGNQGIQIKRGPITATLARLAYQYDPALPEQLGTIDVHGFGDVAVDHPGILLRRFRWSESFKLQPLGKTTIDAVREKRVDAKFQLRVDGNLRANLTDGGKAFAGSIEGLMRPMYIDHPVDKSAIAKQSGAIIQPEQAFEREMTLVPEVFHALDAVSVDTSQIAANMDRLSLFFEPAADYGKRNATKNQLANPLAVAQNSPDAATVKQPGPLAGLASARTNDDKLHAPVARPRPRISGDSVSAKLLITSEGIQPKDVSIEGNVLVKHQINTGDSLMPIAMTGETMRLLRSAVAQASGQDYLQLGSGPDAPAKLTMGDGFFVGPIIKAWPSDNVVQVVGAGELKVPSELLARVGDASKPTPATSATDSPIGISNVEWTAAPMCRWGGGLQFDGQTAFITGGVQIDAELVSGGSPWLTKMVGDEMQIALQTPVEIANQESMSTAKLAQISLVQSEDQPVFVRAEQRSVDQATESVHLVTANRLTFSPESGGTLVGVGPGWYRGWMLMDQKRSILSPKTTTAPHLGGQVLQGVHLTFRESMRGDLSAESLAFTGGVRTGVKKLNAWSEVVDVNQMERLAVGEMTMDCQQLKFGVTPGVPEDIRNIPGMPTPWEMIAEGGIVVRTNTEKRGLIEGTAARASYESKKSWLNITGSPGKSAIMRQTWPNGKPGTKFSSPRMLLNLKTYEFQTIMQDAQINNVQLPNR